MISLKSIDKSYGNVNALTDINLELNSQGFYTVLGPSKAGKTSLLNIIGSLDSPTNGQMVVNLENHDFKSSKAVDVYRRHFVSYVFKDHNLIENLSVYDNLFISSNTIENNMSKLNLRIEKELIDLNILNIKYRKVDSLTKEEKQRVAVARASLCRSKVIIVDEPICHLNSSNEKIVLNKLKKMSKSTLVILATKDKNLAALYSDFIIIMFDSYIVKKTKKHKMNTSIKMIPPEDNHNHFRVINYIKLAINELVDKKNRYLKIVFGLILSSFGLILSLSSVEGAGAPTDDSPSEYLSIPLIEQSTQSINDYSALVLAITFVLFIGVLTLIYNIYKKAIKDNNQNITILRSLGYSKKSIFNIYDIQNLIIGFISASLLFMVMILFVIFNYLFFQSSNMMFVFNWNTLIYVSLIVLLIPILFGLFSTIEKKTTI